jgi:hypothetical protein
MMGFKRLKIASNLNKDLPLYAGFCVAPDALGAKVVAAFLANLEISLSS